MDAGAKVSLIGNEPDHDQDWLASQLEQKDKDIKALKKENELAQKKYALVSSAWYHLVSKRHQSILLGSDVDISSSENASKSWLNQQRDRVNHFS